MHSLLKGYGMIDTCTFTISDWRRDPGDQRREHQGHETHPCHRADQERRPGGAPSAEARRRLRPGIWWVHLRKRPVLAGLHTLSEVKALLSCLFIPALLWFSVHDFGNKQSSSVGGGSDAHAFNTLTFRRVAGRSFVTGFYLYYFPTVSQSTLFSVWDSKTRPGRAFFKATVSVSMIFMLFIKGECCYWDDFTTDSGFV